MSEKPLAERLQVKHNRTLAVTDLPPGLADQFDPAATTRPPAEADVTLAFTPDRASLDTWLAGPARTTRQDAILWIAYPKLTSALAGDLNRDAIRALVLAHGLDTVSQIAIDATWSALRLKRTG